MVILEFLAAVLATFLVLHTISQFDILQTDPFELLHIGSLLAMIVYFGLSCYRQLWSNSANELRHSLRDGSAAGYYPLDFTSFALQEEVMLVASLLVMLQVFRYVFFQIFEVDQWCAGGVGWASDSSSCIGSWAANIFGCRSFHVFRV